LEPGDRVGYLGKNSDRYLEFYVAVPWADGVVHPINTRWATREIAFALQDSETKILLVDDPYVGIAEALRENLELPTVIYVGDGDTPDSMLSYEELVHQGPAVEDARRGGSALAGLFYTGGTTGLPKGVMLSQANLITSATGVLASGTYPTRPMRTLHSAPLFHLGALSAVLSCAIAGGTHVVVPGFEPTAVLDAVERHRVEALRLIPTMIQLLIEHPRFSDYDVSSVTNISYGGSSITEALLDRALEKFPRVEWAQGFGQTEASPAITLLGPEDHSPDGRRRGLLRSAGRCAPHVEIRVVSPEGKELPAGEDGEVLVRGGNVMLGYWNRPEETAKALRDGWLHTGDVGHVDQSGYLFIADRIKDVIVTGGENVYSAEVETALASHPAVLASAVIGIPHPLWGESVHAVVVLRDDASADYDELRAHVSELIAGYKCPRSISFASGLPTSPTGKVLKHELRRSFVDTTGNLSPGT
jgi:acyl-CoA synthetase (AMP-forming)/AMP-acid ligase II